MTLCVLHMSAYRFPLGRAPLAAVKCENGAIQPFVVSPMDGMNCGSIKEALYGGGIDRSLAASGSSDIHGMWRRARSTGNGLCGGTCRLRKPQQQPGGRQECRCRLEHPPRPAG